MPIHTYICTVVACTLNSRLLSGHLGVIAGTLRGFLFPVRYGSVGVQLTRLRKLNQGALTSECVRKNLNATVLQVTCTMEQPSRVFFLFACLKRYFRLSWSARNKKLTVTSKKHAPRPANLLLCLLRPSLFSFIPPSPQQTLRPKILELSEPTTELFLRCTSMALFPDVIR